MWFLCVMVQGSYQTGRVVGKPPSPLPSSPSLGIQIATSPIGGPARSEQNDGGSGGPSPQWVRVWGLFGIGFRQPARLGFGFGFEWIRFGFGWIRF